jgi:hypothetical protein
MPLSATDVDRHRIACAAFECQGGRDRSQFTNSVRMRLAGFEDQEGAVLHCQAMFDHWVSDGVVEPSTLTSVLSRESVVGWPSETSVEPAINKLSN